jgi:hypothetical protein
VESGAKQGGSEVTGLMIVLAGLTAVRFAIVAILVAVTR